MRKSRIEKYGEDNIESALGHLTGLKLPPGSSVTNWKTAFENKMNADFNHVND